MSKFFGNAYLVLATFEKAKASSAFLSLDAAGAVGYMAVRAINAESVEPQLRSELAEIDLTLIATDQIRPLPSIDELSEIDEHLAENVSEWTPGRSSCWGTIHEYLSSETDYEKQRRLWKVVCAHLQLDLVDLEDSDLFYITDKTHQTKIVIVPDDRNDVLQIGDRLIKDGYGYSQVTIDEDDVEPVSASISDILRDWGFRPPKADAP